MEMIGKLKNNFQAILNNFNSNYEVLIVLKNDVIIKKYYDFTLEYFNITEKEFLSKQSHTSKKAFLFIYLAKEKNISQSKIAKYFNNTRQNIGRLINTYTDYFIEAKLLNEYNAFKETSNLI